MRSIAGVINTTLRLVLVVLGGLTASVLAAVNPDEIRDPRPAGWVVDRAGVLPPEDIATLNGYGDAVARQRRNAGLFVVTLLSTQGANHRWFATELLNRWGPDSSLRSGVIILVALEDRRAELVYGDDFLGTTSSHASDRIMRDEIVARLRQNDPRGALLGAVRASAAAFFGISSEAAMELGSPPASAGADPAPLARPANTTPEPVRSRTAEEHPILSLLVGLAIILVPIATFVAFVVWLVRKFTGPRKCRRCLQPMQKLDPAAEAPHLAPGELAEEAVGSVNYDVWHCGSCGGVEKIRRGKWLTSYSRCPKCAAVTRSRVSTTLVAPTRFSTGLAEITESCENCSFHRVTTQRLSVLTDNHHSSGSSRSSSSSSSSGGGSSGSW